MERYLFTEGKINQMQLKNKVIMSALATRFAECGHLTKRDYEFYKARAKGGASAIIMPIKILPSSDLDVMPVLKEDFLPEHKKLLSILHEFDCKLIYQLGYENEKNGTENSPLQGKSINEYSVMELEKIKKAFILASLLAKSIGADGIEINCGDGYFLSQFLSPLMNKREDHYGKQEHNRIRYPLEVLKCVREAVGEDFAVLLRVSGAELSKGGFDIEFIQDFCIQAVNQSLPDAIDVAGGFYQQEIPMTFYQVPEGGFSIFPDAIKRVVSVPVIASVGGFKMKTAEKMLEKGICDFVGMARGFLADANIVEKTKADSHYNVCQRCNACIENMLNGGEAICAYNPEAGKEYLEITHRKIATAKKILVIGGGPAGMMAARKAAERGYKTTLCLKEDRLGGNLNLAALAPGKEDLFLFIENLKEELEKLGVEIRYNTTVDGKYAVEFAPYFVVVATGSMPATLSIPGISKKHVVQANDCFTGDKTIWEKLKKGKTVVVGGGSAGLEVAAFLADKTMVDYKSFDFIRRYKADEFYKFYQPLNCTILEKTGRIASDMGGAGWLMERELEEYGIKWFLNTEVKEIGDGFVLAKRDEMLIKIEADHVILALGEIPADTSLTMKLEDERISYAKIGDADKTGGVFYALHSAFELFLRLYLA